MLAGGQVTSELTLSVVGSNGQKGKKDTQGMQRRGGGSNFFLCGGLSRERRGAENCLYCGEAGGEELVRDMRECMHGGGLRGRLLFCCTHAPLPNTWLVLNRHALTH